MSPDELKALKPGDLIRHKHSADAMIVHANYGSFSVAVRTAYVSNPAEWDRVTSGGSVKAENEA